MAKKKFNYAYAVIGIAVIIVVGGFIMSQNNNSNSRSVNIPIDVTVDDIKFLSDGTPYTIHPDNFLQGCFGIDCIPSIDNPKFESVEAANEWLPDDELGLGVNFNGEKRFYPFRILVSHEIVNDFFGDKPVLVTYCPLCFTGIAFDREIDGEAVEFGVSGKLFNSELIMYDRKTQSYWPQTLGTAVVGSFTGKKIAKIPTDTTRWSNWKSVHSDTRVLSRDTGFFRTYTGNNPYGDDGDYTSIGLRFPLAGDIDTRLPAQTIVYGIEINGEFKAYSQNDLANLITVEDTLGGESITVEFDSKLGSAKVTKTSGESVLVETLFWFAWAAFHPETEVFTGE